MQILGADSAVLTSDLEVEDFLLEHLRMLRNRYYLETVEFVTIIEQNFGKFIFFADRFTFY